MIATHAPANELKPIDVEPVQRVSLSVEEAACSTDISERTIRGMISRGEDFPHFRIGTRVLIPVDGLREWVKKQISPTPANAG